MSVKEFRRLILTISVVTCYTLLPEIRKQLIFMMSASAYCLEKGQAEP